MKLTQLHESSISFSDIKNGDKVITHYSKGDVSISLETKVDKIDENEDVITFKITGLYGLEFLGAEGMITGSFHANGNNKELFDYTLSKIKFSKTASNIHATLK